MQSLYSKIFQDSRAKNKGLSLLLSIFFVTIALALGLGVSNIIFRESKILRGAIGSFKAFYAADAGTECALYWHLVQDAFNSGGPGLIDCNGNTPVSKSVSNEYTFDIRPSVDSCAEVKVTKVTKSINGISIDCTYIDSYGTNESCDSAGSPNIVERGLSVRDPDNCPLNP